MKKLLLVITFALGFNNIQAQQTAENGARQNDIMISPIELIAAPSLNVSYERLLNENSGVGVNGFFYLGNSESYRFSQISPYYRMYFGKKYASGFFVEGFVPIHMMKDHTYNYITGPYPKSSEVTNTSVGFGVGFGGKWVAKRNILFEASAGIARKFNTLDTGNYQESPITGKGMLGIGYRF